MFTVTFLGTGTSQGIPIIACNCAVCKSDDSFDKRLRSSILISNSEFSFVIDTGPDFRQQMLRENVQNLDAVLFTHEHKDHTAGFDDIRAFNFKNKGKAMPVYASEYVEQTLKRDYHYIFSHETYPGIPVIDLIKYQNVPFAIGPFAIVPVKVLHYKLPVFGFRIQNFCYITDANYISNDEKEKLKNLDVLVLNALRHEKHLSHFTLNEALELIDELKPKKAYLTHISHQLGLHSEASKLLPDNVALAYDGLKLEMH